MTRRKNKAKKATTNTNTAVTDVGSKTTKTTRPKNNKTQKPSTTTATKSRIKTPKIARGNNQPSTSTKKTPPKNPRPSSAERSAVYCRREAAKVLQKVLHGDAHRRALASIKTLIYSPTIRNKKGAFALVCQTLKYLPLIKDVLETSDVLNSKWKKQQELMYVATYDVLFGKEISSFGTAEKFLLQRKVALESALAKILVRRKVKRVEDLLSLYDPPDVPKQPRYVRVNTLKLDVDSAVNELGKLYTVQKDDLVSNLLILPPGVDLHDHPLVENGSVFLQGKASSMVAAALEPQPGWEVLDACAAPGNKTVHLAALMKGKGRIVACESNADRVKLLRKTIRLAGANNVEVRHGDFLDIKPEDPTNSEFRAILLDPSCSGSGTAAQRMDYLLPSCTNNEHGTSDIIRQTKLAAFQKKALEHALSFPSVEKIVYSTCSIHQTENEDVIKSVLPMALKNGFVLATPFPQWPRRGLPVFEGSQQVLRMDPVEDKEGFFIALFVRKNKDQGQPDLSKTENHANHLRTQKKRKLETPVPFTRLSKMWFLCRMSSSSRNCSCCSGDELLCQSTN